MRSALGISLGFHLVVSLIALNWVSFRAVKYVPRQVYNVTLVTSQAQAQAPPRVQPAPQPEPEPEPEEEMAPPPDKPKPKPKPRPDKKKVVPTTQVEKTRTDPAAEAIEEAPAETGDVTLDAEDFPFAHYISRMRNKIAAKWRVPQGSQGADRFCRIYFRVHRDGSVTHVTVEESSGLFMFDQSAQRAVVEAAS
ncbi:MAG: TonB C-terminal domain-containing protein, partial [Candidatus Krumholzibacteriota bacterium]|nr:TonB C-terminal domain-containing protein [Candidatus Krumholzibacteriota bacterium]